MLSNTVFQGNRANCWKTTARSGPGAVTGRPSTLTKPAVGNSNPAARRRHVVLPHPDGPTTATNSFSATARSTRSTAAKPDHRGGPERDIPGVNRDTGEGDPHLRDDAILEHLQRAGTHGPQRLGR